MDSRHCYRRFYRRRDRKVMPGKENRGFIMTVLLGTVGSVVATYAGQLIGWYQAGQGAGWIGSTVGAFVVLSGYLKIKGKP